MLFVKVLFLFCLMSSVMLQAMWSSPVNLSETGHSAFSPNIGVDSAGNATAIWRGSDGINSIVQSSYKQFSSSWDSPVNLSQSGWNGYNPQIVVESDGNATAVWYRTNGSNQIVQSSYKQFLSSWDSPVDLATVGSISYTLSVIADNLGNVTAIWVGYNDTNMIIQTAYKPFDKNWGSAVNLSEIGQNASNPRIALDSLGNITAVWTCFNGTNLIIQSAYKPFDKSWGEVVNLSDTGQTANQPQIAIDGAGNATVVWFRSNGTNKIIQSSYKEIEESWTTPDNLSTAGEDASSPQIAVDQAGNVTVVWTRSNGSNTIIQSSYKPFVGNWNTPVDISSIGRNADEPQICADSAGNQTAVWRRYNGTNYVIQSAYNIVPCRVASISPNAGSVVGGTSVTITGTNFNDVTAVNFGETPAQSFTRNSSTSITAVSPSGTAGSSVPITVTASGQTSAETDSDLYTYTFLPCTVTNVSPNNGPISGGTEVTITGTNLNDVTAVSFGAVAAQSFTPISSASLRAVVPIGSYSTTVHVTVIASSQTSETTAADLYTYFPPQLLPPSKFTGIIHKRKQKHQFSIHSKWDESPSSHVASYNIYSNNDLIASIPKSELRKLHLHFDAKYHKVRYMSARFLRELNARYTVRGVDTFLQTSDPRNLDSKK